ncbi:unnamed protein product, partial [Phaeothamnion confervicola]
MDRLRAAIVIQKAFRIYVRQRYKSIVKNWADDDYITQDQVCLIPRKLLCVVHDGEHAHAFHSAGLLSWLLTKQRHPLTMKEMPSRIIHQCRERVVDFL